MAPKTKYAWASVKPGEYYCQLGNGVLHASRKMNGLGPVYNIRYCEEGKTVEAAWNPQGDRLSKCPAQGDIGVLIQCEGAFKHPSQTIPAGVRAAVTGGLLKLLKERMH